MTVYLDSSIVLRRLYQEPDCLKHWGGWETALASELLRVEVARSLDRTRIVRALPDADVARLAQLAARIYESLHEAPLNFLVLRRAASSFPTVVRSLDAIHLATAARACGLRVGP